MGRYSGPNSGGFACKKMDYGFCVYYRLSWTVDYYYRTSALRYPRRFERDTDFEGAVRFCKKHGLTLKDKE